MSRQKYILDFPCFRRMLALCSVILINSCGGPGAPLLRANEMDGEGQLIAGCQNVSNKVRVNSYITEFYLTTWGSAVLEGATEGAMKGSSSVNQKSGGMPKRSKRGETTNPEILNLIPFCRRYAVPFPRASKAAATVLPMLGNPIIKSDIPTGDFETGFIERSHRAARWRDRYFIIVDQDGPQNAIVRVVRQVYIDRSGGTFNQAISVGHNEAWILTRIGDLTEMPAK